VTEPALAVVVVVSGSVAEMELPTVVLGLVAEVVGVVVSECVAGVEVSTVLLGCEAEVAVVSPFALEVGATGEVVDADWQPASESTKTIAAQRRMFTPIDLT
jgi:hypothetical protein